MPIPKDRYASLIRDGQLDHDPVQQSAIEHLSRLSARLVRHHHARTSRWRLFRPRHIPPRGVYMWGGVGRGKTLMMDIFFNNTPLAAKQRVHFHEFMLETHAAIAQWRALDPAQRRERANYIKSAGDDPIPPVARAISLKAQLLCFDEFQVTDIADAMILGRLFEQLFADGVTIVATSNRTPDDLYTDGLNRGLFLPFIETLKQKLDIVHLDAAKDYRLDRLIGQPVYYAPLDGAARMAMDHAWKQLIAGAKEHPDHLNIGGRKLTMTRTARGAARATFDELCARPLGAADYIAIARRYSTLLIDHIPIMTREHRNEAKRFVTLIDTLYENGVKLVASAQASPDRLYQAGDGRFEFERTISRLIEMQSADYLAREHCAVKSAPLNTSV